MSVEPRTADAPVLQMHQIRKTFPGVVALDGVDFELRRGEVHILLGENGAGKSTLMKILSGAYQKTAGTVTFGGDEVEIRNPAHAQALGVSTIYQEFNLVPHLSVGENIFLGREPTRLGLIDRRAVNRRAAEVLNGLGLKLDPRRPVRGLRVAEQQMVEVAKALSLDARVLIMDEPTAALTEHEIKELFAAIRGLKQKGVSIVYISHRMEELFEIGDRVTVLRDGRSVGTFDVKATDKFELIRLMVNRDLTELFPKERAERGEEVLKVEGLTTRGGLKDVSFSLHRGEVLGIAGLLGAGRTELARAIFGLDKVEAGAVHIRGEARRINSPRAAINLGVGFLTEDRKAQGLVLPLSVKENVCLPSVDRFASWGWMDAKGERRAAERYVRELRIRTPGLGQRVVYLSGGNQQKVVLSKWLCSEAEVFIFDEPTRGVDVGAKAEIYQLMNRLTASGVAIIMISSELPEILGMSDRVLVMRGGRVVCEFEAEEATQEKILECALGE
ncbi:MAG TPA: sugar ABC transporter ATP-binding protein [Pyrinomonadaceae bacterium]|nr:sugar ABC transporter ATP-binding protein [Pyrinomonadaceae bacterium]